jgi:CheY-like chemotaxis protein
MRRLARVEGISMEPAASVAFAGFEKLLAESYIEPDERVVINCSGHTFSAEKHALEDRHMLHMEIETPVSTRRSPQGMVAALEQLDEQITTIVIVEDNPHDSRLIRRLLQSYKRYRVFEAQNGPDGLDLVRQRRPDLVILDLTMPGMDGFTVLEELKTDERTSDIPVMIISAKSLTTDEWDYLRRYTESIWQKGRFSARDLADHVVGMLGDDEVRSEMVLPTSSALKKENLLFKRDLSSEFRQGRRSRILVVDDNTWDARLMRRLFEARQRFEVVEAHTGAEALAAIEKSIPDLILLDLRLPDIDGQELLERLRSRDETRNVPVIVISAKDIEPDERAQLTSQADSLWSKAMLDRSNLLAHVEAILPE